MTTWTYTGPPAQQCRWCGMWHQAVCPTVKEIEYHSDGITVKRVVFRDPPIELPAPFQVTYGNASTNG